MSLRARLVASLAATLAVALVLAGVALVGLTRQSLVDRVDRELVSLAATSRRIGLLQDITGGGEAGRRVAVIRLDRQGNVVRAFPSGFAGDADPLPVLPVYGDGIPASAIGTITSARSADGSVAYRVLLGQGPAGGVIAVAAPLTPIEDTTGTLVRALLLVGGLAILALVAVAFVIVRRGLLPLERIARTADEIAAGDLSHRAGIPHDTTEVGRLGEAFDAMLDQIETSFGAQQAALDAKAQSEDRLRQFVADASHELRTPLTAVRGYADLYQAGGLRDAGAIDAAMARIRTESRRMAALVDDLLLLARLDQGRPLRADRVDLARLVADAVADARAVEPARPVTARIDEGIAVTADDDRLRQVVGNLFANVRVHAGPTSPIDVSLRRDGGEAELRVADHGPGIPDADGARVFDRFYRADPGRSRDRGGSGLGLSIVASITAALGGRVWHEATPGGGATFVLRLPVAAGDGTAVHPAPSVVPLDPPITANSQPDPGPASGSAPTV